MPVIPRIGPGEVVPLRPVRPDDVGGGAGQAALSDAAQTLAATTARLVDAEREAAVSQAEVMGTAEIAELTQALEQEPDIDAREQKFEEGRNAILKRHRDTLRGGQYQAAFDQRMFQHGERAKLAVREGVIRKRLDNARGGVIESVDKFDRLIEHAESDQLRKGYIFARSNILEAGVSSGAISAAERAQIEERSRAALEQVEMRKGSQQRADEIVAGGGSITEQLARAREIVDPQMRDLVTARVKDRNEEANSARAKAEEAQRDDYWKRFHEGSLTREEVVAHPGLPAPLRNGLISGFDNRTASGTGKVETDWNTYYETRDIITNPRRAEERKNLNLNSVRDKIAPEQFNQLDGLMKQPDPMATEIDRITNRYVKPYIVPRANATKADDEKASVFRRSVDQAIERERVKLGRSVLSNDEIDAVVRGELKAFTIDDWGSNTEGRLYEIELSSDDQIRLRAELEKLGVANPTYDELRRAKLDELAEENQLTLEPLP